MEKGGCLYPLLHIEVCVCVLACLSWAWKQRNWKRIDLSGVLFGNKTKPCDEKMFVEFSVCRKD